MREALNERMHEGYKGLIIQEKRRIMEEDNNGKGKA